MQPQAIHQSSGDLIADRRYEWARSLMDNADLAGAAGLLAQVLELAPNFASAWFALGEARERLGDRAGAIGAFEKARAADPRDAHGAVLRLTWLGVLPPVAMPTGYVQTLFDGYAPVFESALTEGLGYRGPELLLDAVELAYAGRRMKFGSVLDLGCGTGLAGVAFRPFCDWLVGVDLSAGMLAEARGKGAYDRLIESEAMTFLRAEADINARYHLILAADVFVYFHELTQVVGLASRALAPDGLVVFSVEIHDGDGVILRDTLRYAHAESHVRSALAAGGLQLVSLDSAPARSEKGEPVPGLVVVAQTPSF